MSPRVPEFGKAVQEHDGRALPRFNVVKPDAVDDDLAVGSDLRAGDRRDHF
jgi:hypothetical protein